VLSSEAFLAATKFTCAWRTAIKQAIGQRLVLLSLCGPALYLVRCEHSPAWARNLKKGSANHFQFGNSPNLQQQLGPINWLLLLPPLTVGHDT
jgi:hypothetical protein